jgi:hypothetical protein
VSAIYLYVYVISCVRSCYGPLRFILCFGFGPVQAQQFSGHLYNEASSLGFRGCRILVYKLSCCVCLVKHPSGDGDAVYRIKLLRRFLYSSRIVVLWFEAWCSSSRCLLDSSSSSGDILRVIGRFLSGWLAMKDRDKTHRITSVILIMWYQSQPDKDHMSFVPIFHSDSTR